MANDFLPFAEDVGANVLSQSAYAALPSRTVGFSSGIAKSAEANKVWRQANMIAAMIGQFISDAGYNALDNSDIPTLEQNFKNALIAATTGRVVATTDMTIYVNAASGNDANNGLTTGTAVRTIQQAIAIVYYLYNWNNHSCVIKLAAGTYTYSVSGGYNAAFSGQPFGMLPFGLTLRGESTAQDTVILNNVNANGIQCLGVRMYIDGLRITSSGSAWTTVLAQGTGISADSGAYVVCTNCTFDNCAQIAVWSARASIIVLQGNNNKITGTSNIYAMAAEEAGIVWFPGITLTVSGSITSGSWCGATQGAGVIWAPGATFIGSVTGSRYTASYGGLVQSGGGGPNFFPGSTPGTLVNGWYA